LKPIHGLDGGLSAAGIIKADKSETFALVSGSVNENFGADDVSERQEHLHELSIPKLLRKVIDEEITALGARDGTSCIGCGRMEASEHSRGQRLC